MFDWQSKVKRILFQTGGYRCKHFALRKIDGKQSCCSRASQDYGAVCKLTQTLCPGLAQCPRLKVEEKSKLIELWREDVVFKREIDPKPFLEN